MWQGLKNIIFIAIIIRKYLIVSNSVAPANEMCPNAKTPPSTNVGICEPLAFYRATEMQDQE